MKSEVHSHSRCQISSGATLPLRDFLKQGLVVAVLSTLLPTTTPLMCVLVFARYAGSSERQRRCGTWRFAIVYSGNYFSSLVTPRAQRTARSQFKNEKRIYHSTTQQRQAPAHILPPIIPTSQIPGNLPDSFRCATATIPDARMENVPSRAPSVSLSIARKEGVRYDFS